MKITSLTNSSGTITALAAGLIPVIEGLNKLMLNFCTPSVADFAATCSFPLIPTKWNYGAAIVFGILTFGLKVVRPGGFFHSMFGGTAVIVPPAESGVGTVTQSQVNSNG